LAPHITPENAANVIAAAAGKSKAGIEVLIAARFPRSEEMPLAETFTVVDLQLAPGPVAPPRSSVAPIAAERYVM
jgi:hypothetical protein